METYDVCVLGGGLLGASAGAALAESGKKVLILEARAPHSDETSSYGQTRITRLLNQEDPLFNRTAREGIRAMREMEEAGSDPLLTPLPAVFVVDRHSAEHVLLKESMVNAGCDVVEMSMSDVKMYGLHFGERQVGLLDSGAAVFNPSLLLEKVYEKVRKNNGVVSFRNAATSWESREQCVLVRTKDGSCVQARQIVIAGGMWTPEILRAGNGDPFVTRALCDMMRLERVPLYYFSYPKDAEKSIAVYFEKVSPDGELGTMYAMPELREGVALLKVGFHTGGHVAAEPSKIDRIVRSEEIAAATAYVEKIFEIKPRFLEATVCVYPVARDTGLPVLGMFPSEKRYCDANVCLFSFGGGIAAKHALALGHAASQVMQGEQPLYDLGSLSPQRALRS